VPEPLTMMMVGAGGGSVAVELARRQFRIAKELIDLMLGAMKRANTSVEGLLKYARPQRPLKKPMRLDLLTEDILELYGPRCRELGIAASSRIRFQEPVPGDRELLGQVVQNLFKNAMEAQPEGGSIHLEIEKKEHGVRLRMTNPGFSMPAQEAERILEPYVTTKADGTGLGLSISRRIVEAHGGHMRVQVPEPGTLEITVWLPAADESEPDPNRQKKQGEVSE